MVERKYESNCAVLEKLFENGEIRLNRSGLFDASPKPILSDNLEDAVEGMLLGLAIGDSLGNTSESMQTHHRFDQHGEIRDYLPNGYAGFRNAGIPSDDTQLAFWALEQIIRDGEFVPSNVAVRYAQNRIFGIGASVREFLYNLRSGRPWHKCGPESAGNGALMRIAPILIPHLSMPTEDLWTDTALFAMLTHNDSSSIASCLSFVNMLWQLLEMGEAPSQDWWLDSFLETAEQLEVTSTYKPRGGDYLGFEGTLSEFLKLTVPAALEQNRPVDEACNSWYSGAYLLETMPSVIYILATHGHDFEKAVISAANETRDNDTIAAIVGAAVGALHGKKSIPGRWIENLLGRTSEDDDGKVFELIEESKKFIRV